MGCLQSREAQPPQAPNKPSLSDMEAKKEDTLKKIFDLYDAEGKGEIAEYYKHAIIQDAGFEYSDMTKQFTSSLARRKSVVATVKMLRYEEVRAEAQRFWDKWNEALVDTSCGRKAEVTQKNAGR